MSVYENAQNFWEHFSSRQPEIEQALRLAGAQVYCTMGQDAVFVSDGELFSCVP